MSACWRCGAEFACGVAGPGPCWCMALPAAGPLDAEQACLCPDCLTQPAKTLVAGVDYYEEGAAMVFTAAYHRRRGYCCGSGCRHCPYGLSPP